MEIGIYTFGDLSPNARGPLAAQQRVKEIVAAAQLADDAGLHVFGVGEHHRSDYAVSAHSVVLGAIAAVNCASRCRRNHRHASPWPEDGSAHAVVKTYGPRFNQISNLAAVSAAS